MIDCCIAVAFILLFSAAYLYVYFYVLSNKKLKKLIKGLFKDGGGWKKLN